MINIQPFIDCIAQTPESEEYIQVRRSDLRQLISSYNRMRKQLGVKADQMEDGRWPITIEKGAECAIDWMKEKHPGCAMYNHFKTRYDPQGDFYAVTASYGDFAITDTIKREELMEYNKHIWISK